MSFPRQFQPFLAAAEELLQRGGIEEIEFSGPTYQIKVEKEWAFIQLGDHGELKDSFCSCDEGNGCLHQTAAYLKIFEEAKPLHKRFDSSFYKVLGELLEEEVGDELTLSGKGIYRGKDRVTIESGAKESRETLKEIFEEAAAPTEETSLKFSNLPEEEILLWKQGLPSSALKFELSFWSDFAKWLFLFAPLEADFLGEKPDRLLLTGRGVTIQITLTPHFLERLIPTLGTLKRSLPVHGLEEEGLSSASYDPKEKKLYLTYKKERVHHLKVEGGSDLGAWTYVKDVGFFAKEVGNAEKVRELEGEEIGRVFDYYLSDIRRVLRDFPVDETVKSFSYHLFFDEEENLHLSRYLLTKGDLSEPQSAAFGRFQFLRERGFFLVEHPRFKEIDTLIPREHVSAFISRERAWLGEQRGFETHQIHAEAKLSYSVDKEGTLHFFSYLEGFTESDQLIDFGTWIYIKGSGFYQKSIPYTGERVRGGMVIPAHSVSLFIKSNFDELSLLPSFFSNEPAVSRSGLKIHLQESGGISVQMDHQHREEKEIYFYHEFCFVPGEGFSKLPLDPRLIEKFEHDFEVPKEKKESFYLEKFKELLPFAIDVDRKLLPVNSLQLIVDEIKEEEKTYSLKTSYLTEHGEISSQKLPKKGRFVFTEAGAIDLTHPKLVWLKEGEKKLTSLDLIRLSALQNPKFRTESAKLIWEEATSILPSEGALQTALHLTLRPYQINGVKWLSALYEHGLSGILSDDMGLGKTVQALALIEKVKTGKTLIVSPTSVIYHWQDKIHQFYPEAKLFTFYGSDRTLEGFREGYDILLTSYGILRREIELLKQIPFEIAIFDEIQLAKNSKAKLHSALKNVQASMRVGLTGTPIENNLSELKALFDLTLPNYLPSEQRFRDFFQIPIEKLQDGEKKEMLSKMIHPFILRRVKSEVLLDLPEKIEEITYCPLLPEQQTLYQGALAHRDSIVREIKSGKNLPTLHVFTLLSRLKQICDHPAVFLQDSSEYKQHQSGKWERFEEILEEAREGKQKVVVFSQFLRQLDIFKLYLEEKGIGFAEIRGSTQNRSEEIKRFHEDPLCEVFIGSLQAAGLGIDLTPATVVIHYDRWWNAARENQATDRVHRIGQKRGVQVFKFVTRGTFEEKIHAMIERKGRLMEDVVGVDDQELIKSFTRDELLELLSDVKLTEEDQPGLFYDV